MDIQEAIKVVEAFNNCRTQEHTESVMPDGDKITIALDLLIDKAKNLPIHDVSKMYIVQAVMADRVIEDKVFKTKEEAVAEIGALKIIYETSPQVHIFSGELTAC